MAVKLFWLGRLGELQPLAVPEPGVVREIEWHHAANQSNVGRKSWHSKGYRRIWALEEAYLESADLSMIEQMHLGLIAPPLRLIDPMGKNRLSAAVSAASKDFLLPGGRETFKGYNGAASSVHAQTWARSPVVFDPEDGTGRELSYRPTNGVQVNSDPGSVTFLNGPVRSFNVSLDLQHYAQNVVPVLPGETVTFTIWAEALTAGIYLRLQEVRQDTEFTDSALVGAGAISEVELPVGSASPVSITYTAPTNWPRFAGVVPYVLDSRSEGSNLSYWVDYVQCEAGDQATAWEAGVGTGEVVLESLTTVSNIYPLSTASLTIKEV